MCRELGVSEQTYYRWRKEYGGMKVSQAKRLKELAGRSISETEGLEPLEYIGVLDRHPGGRFRADDRTGDHFVIQTHL